MDLIYHEQHLFLTFFISVFRAQPPVIFLIIQSPNSITLNLRKRPICPPMSDKRAMEEYMHTHDMWSVSQLSVSQSAH